MRYTPKEARESKGVKVVHMAEVLGISRATYWAKESGRKAWSYDESERFSKELNIPMSKIDFSLPQEVRKSDQSVKDA